MGKELAVGEMFLKRYVVWIGNIFGGIWCWDLYPITSDCIRSPHTDGNFIYWFWSGDAGHPIYD